MLSYSNVMEESLGKKTIREGTGKPANKVRKY
jgi:hypothetical protein